jgi:hypothetical protein
MKQKGTTYLSKGKSGHPEEVCTLINSIFYFVGSVYITSIHGDYRLIAKHNGRVLFDRFYPTLRGAKIAFSKLFGHRSWRENVKAEWSDFYNVESNWKRTPQVN